MSDKPDKSSKNSKYNEFFNWEKLTPKEHRFIKFWVLGVIIIFLLVGSYMAGLVYLDKQADIVKHAERMSPNITESGFTQAQLDLPANATPTKVFTGVYIDQIRDFSLSDSTWTTDIYIWFKWNGSNINPGENFQVVDGIIDEKVKKDDYINGSEHYQVYYVTAKINKFFDVLRFPVDNHVLTLEIEDEQNERPDLIYVTDNASEVSSRVQIPGYHIDNMSVIEKPHAYKSNFGDPRLDSGLTSFSQLRAGIDISRPDIGFYFRIFIGLFVAVTAALLALFVRLNNAETRFVMGSGALFVAIANTIITSELIPKTGILTLADMVNDIGLILILMTLVESTISLYLYQRKDKKLLSKKMDLISVILLFFIYLIVNVVIIAAAFT